MNRKLLAGAASIAFAIAMTASPAAAALVTVNIPDTNPSGFQFFGAGNASVTYSGVAFIQSAAFGSANFFNIGSGAFDNSVAVLSSQVPGTGVVNIRIVLPTLTKFFAFTYNTFDGGDVAYASAGGSGVASSVASTSYQPSLSFSFSSATAFDSIQLSSTDRVLNLGSVTYGATPEPAAWALMMGGFGLAGGALRQRRRPATT